MSYESTDMRLMGGVPGQQLFLYKSADDLAAVSAEGYFDAAAEDYNLTTGDLVLAVCSLGGSMTADLLVAENDGGGVSVTAGA